MRLKRTLGTWQLLLSVIIFATLSSSAWAEFDTLPDDGIKWTFAQPPRVVAIGDVHADPNALLEILRSRGLIDSSGKWSGDNTHVVFTGDLFDRGPKSREVIDLVIRLEGEALASGGRIHSLIGNHDMMILEGDVRYSTASEMEGYKDFQSTPKAKALLAGGRYSAEAAGFLAAFTGTGKYAEWMARRNTMIRIGDTLFVHAGIGNWPATTDAAGINATVRAWVRGFQGGAMPDQKFKWVLDGYTLAKGTSGRSPFWMRELADGKISESDLTVALAHYGAKQVVIGHTPTVSRTIEKMYGDRVIRIDTNISTGYLSKGAELSALEIKGDSVPGTRDTYTTGVITAYDRIPRPVGDHPLLGTCVKMHTAIAGSLP